MGWKRKSNKAFILLIDQPPDQNVGDPGDTQSTSNSDNNGTILTIEKINENLQNSIKNFEHGLTKAKQDLEQLLKQKSSANNYSGYASTVNIAHNLKIWIEEQQRLFNRNSNTATSQDLESGCIIDEVDGGDFIPDTNASANVEPNVNCWGKFKKMCDNVDKKCDNIKEYLKYIPWIYNTYKFFKKYVMPVVGFLSFCFTIYKWCY